MTLDGCFWTVQDSFFRSIPISHIAIFQLVLFYNGTRNVQINILEPAMLEHTLSE